MPGPQNGHPEGPLVLGTDATPPAGLDLGPIRHMPAKPVDVLVIDRLDMLNAEGANPPAGRVSPPRTASRTPAGAASSGSSARWSRHSWASPPDKSGALKWQVIHVVSGRSAIADPGTHFVGTTIAAHPGWAAMIVPTKWVPRSAMVLRPWTKWMTCPFNAPGLSGGIAQK